jgi:hypothetical protein
VTTVDSGASIEARLRSFLRSLFLLDDTDLDFGMYRAFRRRAELHCRLVDDVVARVRTGAGETGSHEAFEKVLGFLVDRFEIGDFPSRRSMASEDRTRGPGLTLGWNHRGEAFVPGPAGRPEYRFVVAGWTVVFRMTGNGEAPIDRTLLPIPAMPEATAGDRTWTVPFQAPAIRSGLKAGRLAGAALAAQAAQLLEGVEDPDLAAGLSAPRGEAGESILVRRLRHFAFGPFRDRFVRPGLREALGRDLDDVAVRCDPGIATAVRAGLEPVIRALADQEEERAAVLADRIAETASDWLVPWSGLDADARRACAADPGQVREWAGLTGMAPESCGAIAEAWPELPVCTAQLDPELRARIARSLDGVEPDGILIRGENGAALRWLAGTTFRCVYIDPPYNTGTTLFPYADRLDSATWLTMMEERLGLLGPLLAPDSALFVSIDDNERAALELILAERFGRQSLVGPIVVQSNLGGRDYLQIARTHEYLLVAVTGPAAIRPIARDTSGHPFADSRGRFELRELRNRNPRFHRGNRPNLFYPFHVDPSRPDANGFCPVSLEPTGRHTVPVFPRNSRGEDGCWRWSAGLSATRIAPGDPERSDVVAREKRGGGFNVHEKSRGETQRVRSVWEGPELRSEAGTLALRHLFGRHCFAHPKPVDLVERCVSLSAGDGDAVLDCFAGSGTTGHAVIRCNRRDGARRRFVLVESADHFDSVLVPRICKLMLSPEWKDGRPARLATAEERGRGPRAVRIVRLETFDSALDRCL